MSDTYSTNIFADETVRIIEEHARERSPTPFFVYLPFEAVHGASSCYREDAPPDCNHPDGDELQAPKSEVDRQRAAGITDPKRVVYAAMVGALDEAVKNISDALQRTGLDEETLIVFTTDNGAPAGHFGGHAMSNYPLRGGKGSLFEGGMRAAGFVYAKSIELIPASARGTAPCLLSIAPIGSLLLRDWQVQLFLGTFAPH
jgi:arylsulfatase A-like enzyme